jgi:hypothetical protein
MTENEEKAIVDSRLLLSRRGCALTIPLLKQKVAMVCSDGRNVPSNPTKGPGKKWVRGFFKRHADKLSLRKS